MAFTSTLTVGEHALGGLLGLQPITQVMGSSFQQIGWQGLYGSGWTFGDALVEELEPVSSAYNDARSRALERLDAEARRAGADAVVALQVRRKVQDFAGDAVEFTAIGTAVRVPGAERHAGPVLTNLAGEDHYALVRAGYRPLGLVAATCATYVQASWRTQRLTTGWQRWTSNTELTDFTQGVYQARELALGRLTSQAQALGAGGVVGVALDQEHRTRTVGSGGSEREDLIVTFHVIGTAIAAGGEGGLGTRPVVRRNR